MEQFLRGQGARIDTKQLSTGGTHSALASLSDGTIEPKPAGAYFRRHQGHDPAVWSAVWEAAVTGFDNAMMEFAREGESIAMPLLDPSDQYSSRAKDLFHIYTRADTWLTARRCCSGQADQGPAATVEVARAAAPA
jgi:hypothetical protein